MSTNIRKLMRSDLIYPDLCYKILGVLFDVWTNVGYGHREKIYQNAVAVGLKDASFNVNEQLPAKLIYKNQRIGLYYFDYLIDEKVVLELKVRDFFSKKLSEKPPHASRLTIRCVMAI